LKGKASVYRSGGSRKTKGGAGFLLNDQPTSRKASMWEVVWAPSTFRRKVCGFAGGKAVYRKKGILLQHGLGSLILRKVRWVTGKHHPKPMEERELDEDGKSIQNWVADIRVRGKKEQGKMKILHCCARKT